MLYYVEMYERNKMMMIVPVTSLGFEQKIFWTTVAESNKNNAC